MVKVVLCVATCKRPAGLARLLDAVAELEFEGGFSVVVVDNDAAGRDGLAVCQRVAASYRWPLTFAIEERRGISFARNRAVAVALEQAPDFIAMLDDDEWPCSEWLRELLRVQAETNADVVAGPVFRKFAPGTPEWLIEGHFYWNVRRYADSAQIRISASSACPGTANLIVRSSCFRSLMPVPFDPEFALTGGADVVFIHRLVIARNYTMHWAAHGHVFETVPPSRANVGWLMRRRYKLGNNRIFIERLAEPGLQCELSRMMMTARLLAGGLLYWVTSCFNRDHRVRATLAICRALGRVAGHCGIRYSMYRNVQGV